MLTVLFATFYVTMGVIVGTVLYIFWGRIGPYTVNSNGTYTVRDKTNELSNEFSNKVGSFVAALVWPLTVMIGIPILLFYASYRAWDEFTTIAKDWFDVNYPPKDK